MIRAFEVAGFATLAVAAHLGAWAALQNAEGSGADAPGAAQAVQAFAVGSDEIVAMVEAWSEPTEAQTIVAAMTAPDTGMTPPDVAQSARSQPVHRPETAARLDRPEMPEEFNPDLSYEAPRLTLVPADTPVTSLDLLADSDAPAQIRPALGPAIQGDAPPAIDPASPRPALLAAAPKVSKRPVARPEIPKAVSEPKPSKAKAAPQKPAKPTPAGAKSKPSKSAAKSSGAKSAAASSGSKKAGSGTGNGKPKPKSKGLSSAAQKQLIGKWGGQIRSRIARQQRRPKGSRAKGTAVLRLSVSTTGRLASVTLRKSSGDAGLDRAALDAARKARYPKAPKGLTASAYSFNLPVTW